MKTFPLILTIAGALAFSLAPASAALIIYEGFDYTAGQDIENQSGGTGWGSNNWEIPSNRTTGFVGDSTMTYSKGGTLEVAGKEWAISADDGGNRANERSFDSALSNDQTYWVSWLGSYSKNSNRARSNLQSGGSSVLEVTLEGTNVEIGGDDTGVAATANQTYLFVMELQLNSTGDDTVTYYLSPEIGGASPTNALATDTLTLELGTPDAWDTNFTRSGPTSWDEFRVGTTFADVTPIPEPTTTALLSGTLGLLLLRRRRA